MRHFYIICFSLFIVIFSLLIPMKINNNLEMSKVELGYPIGYIVQDISRRSPPTFPRYFAIMLPQEYPILEIRYITILINIVILICFFELCLFIYHIIVHS